jgi:hypothetical protein
MADNWRHGSTRQSKAARIDTTVPNANLTDPRTIVSGAAETLDFSRPVAILLRATLTYVLGDAAATAIMLSLAEAVTAGSHVELYHQASDLDEAMPAATRRWNAMSGQPITLRSRAQLSALLAGLNLVPPGLVPVTEWHPAPDDPRFEHAVPVYGVVGRKP